MIELAAINRPRQGGISVEEFQAQWDSFARDSSSMGRTALGMFEGQAIHDRRLEAREMVKLEAKERKTL